jgi:hypothetical protein
MLGLIAVAGFNCILRGADHCPTDPPGRPWVRAMASQHLHPVRVNSIQLAFGAYKTGPPLFGASLQMRKSPRNDWLGREGSNLRMPE